VAITNIRYNGKVYAEIDFQHVKRGRGGAFIRVKLKEVTSFKEGQFHPLRRDYGGGSSRWILMFP